MNKKRADPGTLNQPINGLDELALHPDGAGYAHHGLTDDRLTTARAWKRANEVVTSVFDRSLFGNPAFDIMLELYIAQAELRLARVKSVSIASGAPPTTALRYLTTLIERGWVRRLGDPADRRVAILQLTPSGFDRVVQVLDGVTLSNRRLGIGHMRLVQ